MLNHTYTSWHWILVDIRKHKLGWIRKLAFNMLFFNHFRDKKNQTGNPWEDIGCLRNSELVIIFYEHYSTSIYNFANMLTAFQYVLYFYSIGGVNSNTWWWRLDQKVEYKDRLTCWIVQICILFTKKKDTTCSKYLYLIHRRKLLFGL